MNTSTIATILGTAALGLLKSSGSKNGGITIRSINELLEYANDPNKAHLVTDVYLKNKNLTSLPKEIGNLSNLEVLDLINNNLTSLPPEIGNLINLEWLNLRGNNLTSLPKEFGNLINLNRLYLGGNNIQMPSRNTIQYWMNNLKQNVLKKIFENMKPHSQLRRF